VYRAPLGKVDFSLFLAGASGTFKTALAALCQQHFGGDMDARALPAHFSSTANALETLAFAAKDTMLVVDDFVPTGGAGDETLHGIAERLFRGAGNYQGRSRLSGQGKLRAARPPRALLLATGEEVPKGKSLRARFLIIPVRSGDVDRFRLCQCQDAAQQGQFAQAMGAFVRWTAERYEELQAHQQKRVEQLRSGQPPFASHARLPTTFAELQSAWEVWLRFSGESGATSTGEQEELEQRAANAFAEVAAIQPAYQIADDPALQFIAHLRAALASGVAHMKNRSGEAPDTPFKWGWRLDPEDRSWTAQGTCIGWVTDSNVYLDPLASDRMILGSASGEAPGLSGQALRHRLHRQGLLASVDTTRHTLLVRRTLDGRQRRVLHLKSSDLLPADLRHPGSLTRTGNGMTTKCT
jgi:hypothetical protein